MHVRRLVLSLAVLALVAAACGDDDSGGAATPTTVATQDGGSNDGGSSDGGSSDGGTSDGGGQTPTPSANAGFLMLGDERIDFDNALCYLQDQDAFGGGTIHATAQATGTNAAGEEVLFDFTRFGADTDFEGDDVSVTVGDYTTGAAVEYLDVIALGSVSIQGNTVAGTGFNLTSFDFDEPVELASSFEINC